jgi:hypothetical protein
MANVTITAECYLLATCQTTARSESLVSSALGIFSLRGPRHPARTRGLPRHARQLPMNGAVRRPRIEERVL